MVGLNAQVRSLSQEKNGAAQSEILDVNSLEYVLRIHDSRHCLPLSVGVFVLETPARSGSDQQSLDQFHRYSTMIERALSLVFAQHGIVGQWGQAQWLVAMPWFTLSEAQKLFARAQAIFRRHQGLQVPLSIGMGAAVRAHTDEDLRQCVCLAEQRAACWQQLTQLHPS